MDIKEEEEIKKEFQLERIILFTDAVFAIILTIMVLEIKLPEGARHLPPEKFKEAIAELFLKLAGYAVTFGLVGRFWVIHLKLFRFLKDYDIKLVFLNLVFLFSVTLFPFAISLITGSISPKKPEYAMGYMVYFIIFFSIIFMQSLISQHLVKNKQTLCINTPQLETTLKWKMQQINLFIAPIMVLLMVAINYLQLQYYYLIAPVFFYSLIIKTYTRKYYPEEYNGPLLVRLFQSIKPRKIKRSIK
ncbi:MAG: hypothetical protein JWQ34_2946 [Mucilaginibacter sp.]|uniref:TMEM175 family protein n=1 Tax=Mucilaginibacter sp. TaxID=1882438 RepID=UPI002611A667|nr:TMEM175 family protein [Mucilaginibacter sp.]MDB5004721.1 hypothetical protein [Mucilaginibacter sp.]